MESLLCWRSFGWIEIDAILWLVGHLLDEVGGRGKGASDPRQLFSQFKADEDLRPDVWSDLYQHNRVTSETVSHDRRIGGKTLDIL
jgi:hypothetical protein